jgi:phosphoglycerate dehydrogenase-like enzyme
MPKHTLLVLNNPVARHLTLLDQLPDAVRILAGDSLEAFSAEAAAEADILLVGAVPRSLVEEVWAMAPRLQWVHTMAAGLDTLLFPALVESPVPLTNTRGVFAPSLGEFALAGILWFAKGLGRMRSQQQAGVWEKFDVETLAGRRLGILGHGSIGRETAWRAETLGMVVTGLRHGFPREELEEILRSSDYFLVAAPLTETTRGLIGEAELRLMKPSAVLLNLGRGPVVDERALVAALREKRIRGAVLDVFDVEPLPAGHPFYELDNVLLSPHCADNTDTWLEDAMKLFLRNFEHFDAGRPLENLADKRRGY